MLMLLLFATGLFAGTVDAIAGGGGLISLPMLLSLGVPPHLAFGTNKLQGSLGTFMAARRYYQHGLISLTLALRGIIAGLAGSFAGAVTAQLLDGAVLHHIVPVLLGGVLLYTIFSPRVGMDDHKPRLNVLVFYLLFGFILGFYDGFFGPGVGSLWVFALTYFLGYNLIKATAYTKIFNLNSSLVATACFMAGGNIDYRIAFCMAAGQLIGGKLGASLAIRNGSNLIRPVFLAVVSFTIATLTWRNYAGTPALTELMREHGMMMTLTGVVGMSVLIVSMVRYYRQRKAL